MMFPKKSKSLKMTDEKAKLRKIFNEYIRVRDSIKTTGGPSNCRCCTCRKIKPNSNKQIHAGHFIKSDHNSVTFDPRNVHGQCLSCNNFQGGKEAEYSGFIIRRYGLDVFEWLLAQKFVTKQWKAWELIEMQHKYSDLLDKMIADFPEYKRKSPKPSELISI